MLRIEIKNGIYYCDSKKLRTFLFKMVVRGVFDFWVSSMFFVRDIVLLKDCSVSIIIMTAVMNVD